MSTFEELTKGTSAAAQKVNDFFKAIRATFSPVPITSTEQTSGEPNDEFQSQTSTTTSLFDTSHAQKRDSSFFSGATSKKKKTNGLNLVVVVHLLPTLPAYLRALQHIGDLKVIIFKGAAKNDRPQHMKDLAEWVEKDAVFGPAVRPMTKNDLKIEKNVIELLSDAADHNDKEILIMDIGGYFAPCLSGLVDRDNYKGKYKLLGIVEDTENGHQKYHCALENLASLNDSNLIQPNIYSVARSRMKMTEDYNVGKSLVRAADSILRQSLDLRLEDHRVIGVLGFGKIGSSIAMHLRQQHIGIVMVYDVNPEILLRANSYDFVICTKEDMLQQASFIFCATGNKALTYNDLMNIGTNIKRLIIASCTSADDELDVHDGLQRHEYKNDSPDPRSFSRYNIKRLNGESIDIILLCDGNAVNFSYRAVLGESIRSVQAAMMVCALNLQQLALKNEHINGINTLTNEEEMRIARLWLQHFSELDVHLITNVSCAYMKFDKASVEETVGDLPVDQTSVTQLKQHLGLVKSENTDSIDFMDSERKLIITASRGSGKTAVLFSLIHDVRNYYDLIWWFDCNDSMNGTLLALAQEFHVSSVELSIDELQEEVLKKVFSSLVINNILLVVDNVQEVSSEKPFEVTAHIASTIKDGKTGVIERQFKCHDFLFALDNVIDLKLRQQRRCHIVALYTDDSANQPPSAQPTTPSIDENKNRWLYLPLQEIVPAQAEDWVIRKFSSSLEPEIRANRKELISKILSVDVRRLTIRLTGLLLTSELIKDDELKQVKEAVNGLQPHKKFDMPSLLIKLSLNRLKQDDNLLFLCIQVASLIHTGSISREVFQHLYDILPEDKTTGKVLVKLSKTSWQDLSTKLKKYCILKQNLLVPMIHIHATQRHVTPDYVAVYSMPSTYARALRKPLLADKTTPAWEYALQLVKEGFNYDYYSSNGVEKVVHYLDHATALIKHTDNWIGDETHAPLLGELLCRLGCYYLNERRMYSEATTLYFKASTILGNILNQPQYQGNNTEKTQLLLISKWSATLMCYICDQLIRDSSVETDKESISRIEATRNELKSVSINLPQSRRYQLEAIIAVARIRVQNGRKENASKEKRNTWLEPAKKELENIKDEKDMGDRTLSSLLQVLGNTYSLLEDHQKAVDSCRQALNLREDILPSGHLDVARTKYWLAFCLVDYISTMNEEDRKNKATEVKDKLNEAKILCETAFGIQKEQLPNKHINLKECSDLSQRIENLLKK